MPVSLRPITAENWVDCVRLKPAENQTSFVAPNAFSLAQAHYEPWWEPFGIYHDDTLVGFVMLGRWPEAGLPTEYQGILDPGVHCILRFMIDREHQRRGYGRAALMLALEHIRAEPGAFAVQLSYEPDNTVAAALYATAGFRPTGRVLDGEVEAWLDLV
jgi:diamine N-acetyltransferase